MSEEENLWCVTTLVQDPAAESHCLRSWTKMYDMLGVPEALQRELVMLSIMLEQPSFVPLDMLIETYPYCRKSRISGTRKCIYHQ
jgi:hypothetical protein